MKKTLLVYRLWSLGIALVVGVAVGLASCGISILLSVLAALGFVALMAALVFWVQHAQHLKSPVEAFQGLKEGYGFTLVMVTAVGLMVGTSFYGFLGGAPTSLSRRIFSVAPIFMVGGMGLMLYRQPATGTRRTENLVGAWISLIAVAFMTVSLLVILLVPALHL